MLTSSATKMTVAVLLTLSTVAWHPGGGEFKCYMDYRAITDTGSPQYQLQLEAWTDDAGIRRVGCFYCVALGSAYGSDIGAKYLITLSTGQEFLAILSDQKADKDTVQNHTKDRSGAVIEFVVDTPKLSYAVKNSGSISSIPMFKGEVVKIRRLDKDVGM